LQDKTQWTDEKIQQAMNAGKEKWVMLNEVVPVFISYFTAWVDQNGSLHFRDDIYGHDKRMKERLFE
jgi:L,D-transpeptidase YcbB